MTTVDPQAADRIRHETEALAAAGLAFQQPTLYEVGTRLVEAGEETYSRSRTDFDARPGLEETYARADAAYRAQDRRDFRLDELGTVHCHRGRLTLDGYGVLGQDLGVGQLALGQLVARLGGPACAGPYLAQCPEFIRDKNVNEWAYLAREATADKVHHPALVRTMLAEGGRRAAYAVLSKGYRVRDLPACREAFERALGRIGCADARGEFRLAGPRWMLRATLHSALPADLVRVGELFRGAVWVYGTDDGTGSVGVGSGIERAQCVNLTTGWAQDVVGLRHNSVAFDDRLEEMLRVAVGRIASLAEAWGVAAQQQVVDRVYDGLEPEAIFRELVRRGLVKLVGVPAEELVRRLVSAWRMEPGYQRTDIVNAVTRAAHTQSWRSPWCQDELEQQAGGLLQLQRLVLQV